MAQQTDFKLLDQINFSGFYVRLFTVQKLQSSFYTNVNHLVVHYTTSLHHSKFLYTLKRSAAFGRFCLENKSRFVLEKSECKLKLKKSLSILILTISIVCQALQQKGIDL